MQKYKITGVDSAGKRFRRFTDNLSYAKSINVYRGTLWEMQPSGKWRRIHAWYN